MLSIADIGFFYSDFVFLDKYVSEDIIALFYWTFKKKLEASVGFDLWISYVLKLILGRTIWNGPHTSTGKRNCKAHFQCWHGCGYLQEKNGLKKLNAASVNIFHSWFHFAVDCKSDKILLLWKFKWAK